MSKIQRLITWAVWGTFCTLGTQLAHAQEGPVLRPSIESLEVPQTMDLLPPRRDDDSGLLADENAREDDGRGLRLGSFVLSSNLEAGVDYTDNAFSSASDKTSDRIYSISSSLDLESDWSRHAARLSFDSVRQFYEKNSSENSFSIEAEAQMRIDIKRNTNLDLRVGYSLDQEERGSVDLDDDASELADIKGYSASATINHRINRITLSLRSGFEMFDYEDTELSGGGVDDNSDRDYRELNATLRVGYDISPNLIVFSEVNYADIAHDRRIDDNGDIRDSHSYGASVGVTVAFSELLSGEVLIGYRKADFDDATFDDVDALILNASLTWRPSELTEVTASLATDLGQTTLGGSSGTLTRTASLGVTHAWRENIELSANASVEHNDFNGLSLEETTYNFSLGVDYDLGRNFTLGSRYVYEKFDSSAGGEDHAVNTVGVRLTYTD